MTHPLEAENRRLRAVLAGLRHIAEWAERSRYSHGTVAMIDALLAAEPASWVTHPLEDEWRRLREALEKIANRPAWLGRKNYAYTDEGIGEYWSDMAKEFQADARAALAAEPASGEADEVRRLRETLKNMRPYLVSVAHFREDARANDIIFEIDAALAAEPASGEANDEPSEALLERGREQALQMLEVSRAGYERGHADALKLIAETAAEPASGEAARAENEACAKIAEDAGPATADMHSTELCEFADRIAAAIRARIKP